VLAGQVIGERDRAPHAGAVCELEAGGSVDIVEARGKAIDGSRGADGNTEGTSSEPPLSGKQAITDWINRPSLFINLLIRQK
jgi:hypothetical protein